jgi:hypothetical protein
MPYLIRPFFRFCSKCFYKKLILHNSVFQKNIIILNKQTNKQTNKQNWQTQKNRHSFERRIELGRNFEFFGDLRRFDPPFVVQANES